MNIREFFGFGGYTRPAEGYMSWQHLTFVSSLTLIMIVTAVFLALKNKHKDDRQKNKVLIASALLIDGFELIKIVILCIRGNDPWGWLYNLPLFLCSIQLISIPMAAFSKGKLKDAALDFVTVFGLPGALLGTYFAGNNYSCYPVLSMDNVVSGITHCISGFSALYILISGMASLKKRTFPVTLYILLGFSVAAYVANLILDCNYMFLMRGDGTPYDILYNLLNGNTILYPIAVVALFIFCMAAYYQIFYAIVQRRRAKVASLQK